ncbi:MAG: T9SS type A sorting domain-containing protein [Candidatus Cloacimonetes bacterium]|nr:T9SS type A sorting domain-containing protein [Candidatus Cloacimonadota bacterium]
MKIVTIFLLLSGAIALFADEVIEYNFDYPQIREAGEYSELIYENCINLGEEGDPAMPQMAANILLLAGEIAQSVEVVSISYYEGSEILRIMPAGRPVPLSKIDEQEYPLWESAVYRQQTPYPDNRIAALDTGFLSGHPITSFTVCPVEYTPLSGETRFMESITLKIRTINDSRAQSALSLLRHDTEIKSRLSRLIDNISVIDDYSETSQGRPDEYDILLITSAALLPQFGYYITYKESCGFYVATQTVESIYGNYPGADEQTKIRNAIIDCYQNQNISYVILGGDSDPQNAAQDVIPHRGFYANAGGEVDYDIPADMYYACLDGTWNDDNDNMWGESNEDDLYAEVSIGRICADTALEVQQMTHKLITYGNSPVEDNLEEFLMIGEYLWPQTYGGQYMNEVAAGGNSNGYYTEGFSDNIIINTLYEMDYDWTSNDLYNALNAGVNMVHHLGHGNPVHCFNIENSNLTTANLTNNGITSGYYTAYSQACYSGAFDNRDFSAGSYYNEDCFCEKITTMSTAASSFIANSRYGWGMQQSTNGASQYFHRQYADAIFGENFTRIGDANGDSKEDNAAYINSQGVIRWCCYELNLFGDPSMDIWTAVPEEITVSTAPSVPIGIDEISVNTNVTGARVAIVQGNILLGRGVTNFNGDVDVQLENPISDPQPLDIVVTAHNCNPWESMIIVVSDQPYVIYEDHTINEITGNGNGIPDYNESLSVDLQLYNVGNQPATGASLVVTSFDQYIQFTDNTETIGLIAAETVIELADAISFSISDDVPDQHVINFYLIVSDDNGSQWSSDFDITVNAPALVYTGLDINDSINGDNDGILDPGETAAMTINILNSGQSLSPAAILQLSSSNPDVTIEEFEVAIGEIAAGETVSGTFTVIVGSEIEIGTPVEFTLICDSDNYTILEEFVEPVGLIIEDFESGSFNTYEWQFGGSANWTINNLAYEGSYSAESGTVGDNQNSVLQLELDVLFDGYISFWYRVSSEAGYDFLHFYIDGEEQNIWGGEIPWTQASFEIEQGNRLLEWRYEKDGYVSSGSDCAWIDYIIFPAIGIPDPAEMLLDTEEINFILEEGEAGYAGITIANEGEANLEWSMTKHYLDSRDSGGPDDYGYMWTDSNEAGAVEFEWIDISATGTALTFTHNDVGVGSLPIGFTFNFYGTDYDEFLVNPNGWIGFGEDNEEWSNSTLPDADSPRPAIFPFWDDLYPEIGDNGSGTVYYQSFDNYLVVMFDNVIHYPGNFNGTYDFEVILWSNGDFKLQYNTLEGDLDTCTIGIQNASATDALQIIRNNDYLEENLAIEVKKVVDWLQVSALSGILPMNEEILLQLTAESVELETGEYICELIINSNDPLQPSVIILVTMTIGMGIIYGDVDGTEIVDAYDASCVLQYVVGNDPLPLIDPRPWETDRLECADVDNNNEVEAYDGSLILQYVVGIITEFPAENGDPVYVPEADIRLDIMEENDVSYLVLIAGRDLLSFSMSASELENVIFGEPELLPQIETSLAWSETEDWQMAFCQAVPFTEDTAVLRIPLILNENSGEETFLIQINTADWEDISFDFSPVAGDANDIIRANELLGNYPNPFNPLTCLRFNVKDDNSPVRLDIYNIRGQHVTTLIDGICDSGRYNLTWNASAQASGVYFYQVKIGDYSATRKMLMIK